MFQQVDQVPGAYGVVPVENSAAGSVAAVYDLILQYRFFIVGAVDVKVAHCLAAPNADEPSPPWPPTPGPVPVQPLPGGARPEARGVVQHRGGGPPRGAGAPRGHGGALLPGGGEQYGLTVLQEGVQNEKNNTTRFVVISKEPIFPEDAGKISLCFSNPHTTGSLYHVLERFALCGLNLTKIESRPIPGKAFEYDFYLDFTGNIHHRPTLDLICALHDELPRFSFLGNYSEG